MSDCVSEKGFKCSSSNAAFCVFLFCLCSGNLIAWYKLLPLMELIIEEWCGAAMFTVKLGQRWSSRWLIGNGMAPLEDKNTSKLDQNEWDNSSLTMHHCGIAVWCMLIDFEWKMRSISLISKQPQSTEALPQTDFWIFGNWLAICLLIWKWTQMPIKQFWTTSQNYKAKEAASKGAKQCQWSIFMLLLSFVVVNVASARIVWKAIWFKLLQFRMCPIATMHHCCQFHQWL